MSKKKLLIPLVLLLVLGVGYTMTKPKKTVKQKIPGTIYLMPQPFLLNLAEGHYAKISVALELAPGQSDGAIRREAPRARGKARGRCPRNPPSVKS